MLEIEVTNKLNELGDTRRKIARRLKKQDIMGYRGARNACPIANYLRKEFDCQVRVSVTYAKLRNEFEHDICLPRAISEFILAFDEGKHPSLELKPSWQK